MSNSNKYYQPVNSNISDLKSSLKNPKNRENAEDTFRHFLKLLGFDLTDPNMSDTPKRVTSMYMDELFSGITDKEPEVTLFDLSTSDTNSTSEMIVVGPIPFKSMCSHHLMPIVGNVYLGVLLDPDKKVFPGLSKYHRLVNWFARRPQIQEQFTQQLLDYFVEKLEVKDSTADNPQGVMVVVKGFHFCVSHRGVGVDDSSMITSAMTGAFRNSTVRAEFMSLINLK